MENKTDLKNILTICVIVFSAFFAIWTFTGRWFWISQPYNSYILQAQAWCDGHLSLSENFSHLELAIFNGKYYVSFPPFPSYVMFPFVLLGFTNCDGLIALISAMTGAMFAYKILRHFNVEHSRSILYSLLLTIGSNWLFTAQSAWVWFIAQNMAFTLSLIALYFALKKRVALSLAVWACAVGCRPFQALYLPVILYLLYDRSISFKSNALRILKSSIPMLIIAASYMVLNFARFGNPLEFGHNYLPEFTEAPNGQFSLVYIAENITNLFRLPTISFTDKWEYQAFNGTNIFIISPIFIAYIAYIIYALTTKSTDKTLIILTAIMATIELLCITAHKTMGGSQFGNRYTNDVLPLIFLSIAHASPKTTSFDRLSFILLIFGFTVNTVGSVLYYV